MISVIIVLYRSHLTSHSCLRVVKLRRADYLSTINNLHLSFLSKLTERVVKLRLVHYLSTNNLLGSFQSAYIKHHSTETTLLSVPDHIINN